MDLTKLTRAVNSGDVTRVRQLLREGFNPNMPDTFGVAPLHGAASRNYQEIISELIAYGAKVNVRDEHGGTPLHWALRNGKAEAAILLLQGGAQIDALDNAGKRPADWAAQAGHTAVMVRVQEAVSRMHARKYKMLRRPRGLRMAG